ncbi:MAG: protein kinase, partial [Planctomycetes bacterium]|nr:protein kinase [Planctomycetota bacterium]
MAEERRCGQCGKGLPADAPGGLCPECLLKVGLQSQSKEPPDQGPEGAPPTAAYGRMADDAARKDKDREVVLSPGQQFGGYRVVRRLGSGGMGTVYEADHLESGRRVALKVLGHRLDSPEAKQRFLREGRLAASVNHPNSVYVFGTEEIVGVPVIAMELVSGGTLEERVLRSGPFPVGEAVDAILQVIDGLEAAEAGGVLHRDVKAANCFVDREGAVKVGDFGLSISTSLRGDSNLTNEGTFLGTPAFSSPEQLRGDELDIRSDIYAVGVTLYYLLTGRMPYRADNLVRLIAAVLEHPPRSPAELRPEIPKSLARAVLCCLQKQPAARFRTYDELRQALAPFGSAAPTPAALGLRLGAGIVDYFIWAPVAAGLTMAWIGDFERMASPDFFGSLEQGTLAAIGALLHVLYFAVPEGLWGASAGKAICGVRVVNPRRNAPGVAKALIRAAVYVVFPQTVALACAGLIAVGLISEAPLWLLYLVSYSWFAMLALLFSTARRRNGYAGLHDRLSNTRVVLKSVYRPRPVMPGGGEPPEETEATPTVGPYHVLSSLDEIGASRLLLGYDTRLLRRVWIRT